MPHYGKISVVFLGSGPVAARCLQLLIKHTNVELVITKPRPLHHKYDVPVLTIAQQHNLPVITASNKAELDIVVQNTTFTSKLAVLIDFGIIVSQNVIDAFALGIINSHFSLLPYWRGADPITFAIASSDSKTGVSLMMIDSGMDTGQLLTQSALNITAQDTSITLTDKLINLSDTLLQEFIPQYVSGTVKPKSQPHPNQATYSRKLTKQDSIIDWLQPAKVIECKIRAHLEWPGSRCTLNNLNIIITAAHVVNQSGTPGGYNIQGKELIMYAGQQALSVDYIKPAGKKEMPIQAFLAGYSKYL